MLVFTTIAVLSSALCVTAVSPIVTTQQGQYSGKALGNGVSQWLGMRYAAAPVGGLRFKAPQKPAKFTGVASATISQPSCGGTGPLGSGQAEDCLYLSVWAPTTATTASKLPVLVWVPGGGFVSDSRQNTSALVSASKGGLVTVSLTYRAGALGFLAGKQLATTNLNNGLRDQRQALQWVQQNIAQFGGDPGHVTLAGQSAGAGSVLQHLVASNGTDQNLFQASIMESPSLPPVRSFAQQQYQYDGLATRTNCASSSDSLTCLRNLPVADLLKQVIAEPYPDGAGAAPVFSYNPVIDGDFVTELPLLALQSGRFVKVPTLLGTVVDEGAIFTPHSLSDQAGATNFLKNNWPAVTTAQLSTYVAKFGLDPAQPPAADDPALKLTDAQGGRDYWHRPSLAYGETRYACPSVYVGSYILHNGAQNVYTFHYYGDGLEQASDGGAGATHSADLDAVWGGSKAASVRPLVQGYWASFVRHYDPNTERLAGAPTWDKWNGAGSTRMALQPAPAMESLTAAQKDRCGWLEAIAAGLEQ